MKIGRRAYAEMFGPTAGDRVRLADTELIVEVERDLTVYGEEVKFGGGKVDPRRHGPEPAGGEGLRRHGDHQCARDRLVGHREVRHRDQGRQGREARQGGQPGHPAGSGHRHRRRHRNHRRRRDDRHRGRGGLAHPFHLSAADRRGADVGRDDDDRRRHGSRHRHVRDDVHARTLAHAPDARSGGSVPDEPGLPRQGQREPRRAARRAGGGRRDRPEAARRLGHDARGDRRRAQGRRQDGRAGRDPYRHAERIGLRRDDARRDRRPHDPYVPHRGRGRRPRARHHPGVRRAERAAVVDQPDAPLHRQHDRRAPRHADGVSSPRSGNRRGHRVRRIADPARDDRRRRHPARPRRLLDAFVGLAGDGPGRRSDHPHVADRAQDEGAARQARRRSRRRTTTRA